MAVKGATPANAGDQNANSAFEQAFNGEQKMNQEQRPFAPQGVMGMNARLARPMPKSSVGETVVAYLNTLKEIAVESGLEDAGFKLLVLDGQSNLLALSAILIVMSADVESKPYAVVHTLIVEGSGARLLPREITVNNQRVEQIVVASDVYDQTYWKAIQQALVKDSGMNLTIVEAGSSVIPTELEALDKAHLRRIVQNATGACFTTLNMQLSGALETAFNVGPEWITARDQLVARVDYSPVQAETMSGLPRRGDITVELQGQIQQQTVGQLEQSRALARVTGYVDLVYSPPSQQQQQQQMFGYPVQQGPVPTQHYYPRAVLTGISTELDATTMETQLLALSTFALLNRHNGWVGGFTAMPYNASGVDMRDLGAVGYEINLSNDPNAARARIDTKAESFTPGNMQQLVAMAMHPKLIYSFDVEESGDESWINLAFIAAAAGAQDATAMIVEAADRLTLNCFSKVYKGGPIAVSDQNRIHTGYYMHPDGSRRDIRDLDYLAMLNLLGADDMKSVVEFADTFDNHSIPLEVRLEKRARIIRHALGDSVHFKGFAYRITFNPNFIEAVAEACAMAGLVIRPQNLVSMNGSGQRGNADVLQYAAGPMTGNQFNYVAPGFVQQNNMGQPFSRWTR